MQVHKSIGTKPLPISIGTNPLPISTNIANFIILSKILSKLLNIKPDFYSKKATWPYVQRPTMALKKSLKAKIWHAYRRHIYALSPTIKEIQAILCFGRKFENSKWPPFFETQKFLVHWAEYLA